jgi:hypothetical protein
MKLEHSESLEREERQQVGRQHKVGVADAGLGGGTSGEGSHDDDVGSGQHERSGADSEWGSSVRIDDEANIDHYTSSGFVLKCGGAHGSKCPPSPPPMPPWRWPPPPPPPPPPAPPVPDLPNGTYKNLLPRCQDKSDQCLFWRQLGECAGNPGYMLYNCGGTCNVCNVSYVHKVQQKVGSCSMRVVMTVSP